MKRLVDSICVALVGLPGAGKSHLKKKVLDCYPNFKTLIPVTTRKPRQDEIHGRDKYFISEDEFQEKMYAGDLFLEMEAYSQKSGFSKMSLCDYQCYISEFYYKDILTLANVFKKCIFILIMPENIELLVNSLIHRGEALEETEIRIKSIGEELAHLEELKEMNIFDFIFINNYDKNSEDRFVEIIGNIYEKHMIWNVDE